MGLATNQTLATLRPQPVTGMIDRGVDRTTSGRTQLEERPDGRAGGWSEEIKKERLEYSSSKSNAMTRSNSDINCASDQSRKEGSVEIRTR